MSKQTYEGEENPMASVDANDIFVFMPSVATVVILVSILYGFASISVQLLSTFVVPLSNTIVTVGTVGLAIVYIGTALGLIYRDNQIELPLPSF